MNKNKEVELRLRNKIRGIIVEKLLNEFSSESAPQINSSAALEDKGLTDLAARRKVQLRAREAAFKFEEEIIKGLGLKDPDQMDANSQRLYTDAVGKLERGIIRAVLEVIPDLAILPKEEVEEKNTAAPATKSPIPTI